MRKTLYALLMCTVAFGPTLAFASGALEDTGSPARPATAAPVQAPKPGPDQGVDKDALEKTGAPEKKPTTLEEKGQALQDKAIIGALGAIGAKDTKDNRELALETGKAAVETIKKNTNLFKDALEATKAKTAAHVQKRADEGLETSKARTAFANFRYGAWEFTKATVKTTVNFVKENPELIGKIVITIASALLL